uniref:PDZ domain-containing protein n=1 Tax=Clastoptera arizonana TaxID=38151 RepID=A0A1B6DIR9_9HEMI
MFSSLKLPNLRPKKLESGPPHLDLTAAPPRKSNHVITTTRKCNKWSIDKALCPGRGGGEAKVETPEETQDFTQNNTHFEENNWFNSDFGWEGRSNVQVISRIMSVSIERDMNGSLGITLRGGAQANPDLTKPLVITQVRPGGAADREGTIKVGDRLLSVDGKPLTSVTLSEAQSLLQVNSSPITTLGIEYDVSIMASVRCSQGPLLVEIDAPHCHNLGLDLVNTPDNTTVVIGHIKVGSIAERCGALLPGDQILAVNDVKIEDTKMSADEVSQLLWTGNSCVLQILPSFSSYRGYPQPNMYSCPSPSLSGLSSVNSRQDHQIDCIKFVENHSILTMPASSNSNCISPNHAHENSVEATSTGVYHKQIMRFHLEADPQGKFGLTLGPNPKFGTIIIVGIEPRSPAERCGSLQVGDRVTMLEDKPTPGLSESKKLEDLIHKTSVAISIEFAVAQTITPSSGIFTVKLSNNKICGLGITITGNSGDGTVISHIRPGSVAHRCGILSLGDRILSVNNHNLDEYTLDQAMDILHSAQDIVSLVVQKAFQDMNDLTYSVELARNGGPLGITIAGSEDPNEPIIISALTPNGLAERMQVLHVGDRILAIDGHSLNQEPLSSAITLLQESGDKVQLCIARSNQSVNKNVSLQSIQKKPVSQKCDNSLLLSCNSHWPRHLKQSNNSLNTVQSDAEDTCSSFHLSQSVLNNLTVQLGNHHKCAPPNPPCPLLVNYQLRNNTLPTHRRRSSSGIEKFNESEESNLISSPRRCRKGFHIPDNGSSFLPLYDFQERRKPGVNFDTFFKNAPQKSEDRNLEQNKNNVDIFQVTLYKDPVYEDFGFSVSDGLYERGVFINRIRHGGPADNSRLLRPYDRILQVNETRTEDLDCCLTVPLVASAGEKILLTVSRNVANNLELKDNVSMLPWVEEEQDDFITTMQSQTFTKTL